MLGHKKNFASQKKADAHQVTLLTEVFTKKKGQELWPFLMEPTVNLVLMKSIIQIKLIRVICIRYACLIVAICNITIKTFLHCMKENKFKNFDLEFDI